LLNRGKSDQGEETSYLICPSQAFAPMLQPISNKFSLPQIEAAFGAIEFDAPGTEEYIGIVVKTKPDNRFLQSIVKPDDSLPIWGVGIYQLWQELEKQAGCQVFYQSFEVGAL
jgi:hypothetical protein